MTDRFKNAANDLLSAVKVATWESRDRLVISWVYVPVGVLAILSACFGVDKLLTIGSISFPASVACLIILFLGLLLLEQCIGEHRARRIVSIIDIPGGWSLRWINIFFTPSFVLLPLSPPIGGIEVLKIIAVFVIGFFVMMISATYITRGLQVLFGTSKRAMVERAEELRTENEAIPMTVTSSLSRHATTASESEEVLEIQQPERSQAPPGTHQTTSESSLVSQAHRAVLVAQAPIPPSRVARWSILVSGKLDMIAYAALFIFVGLPVYYAADYAMPLQLTFNILTYFAAMSLPATWRQYLHPVLVSSLFTVLGIWVLGLIKDQSLGMTLLEYRPGANYLKLWNGQHRLPGAGDIFGSVLDASIVCLALPLYQYRRELRQHFFVIIIPNVVLSIASLFAYPYICFAIGITATRSLAFAARSLTVALATPAVSNLGGDANTVAALAIMSGIVGVLVGQRIFALLRIRDDDYITRGVALGANSSAIATAFLLRTDPRAAALCCLSMSLFGTITVLSTSIPPIVTVVRSLVNL